MDAAPVKYIFVTGGVVSSLGKGLTAAAVGAILESRGLRVAMQKLDPYLNVDPGTMNPSQHGEVYVLDDGSETDLDLGHYERMTSGHLSKINNVTSGQVYETVLSRERRGEYLGQTVQVIPHVTDEIKNRIAAFASKAESDVVIIEIGGTVGDIEGLPFAEAIRQFMVDAGRGNSIVIHLTLVPFLKAAGEVKTKPTQQGVAKLREIGLRPDIIVCRMDVPLDEESRRKISLFCNVPANCVIEAPDVQHTVYEVPAILHQQKTDMRICELLGLNPPVADIQQWENFVERVVSPRKRIGIALVGKYTGTRDAYKSICEALLHAGASMDCGVDITYVDSETIAEETVEHVLAPYAGILIPGGFGSRGIEGKIIAANYARTHLRPFLGICLGMQVAVIEAARNIASIPDATSQEFSPEAKNLVIHLMQSQEDVEEKGGTMRLGAYPLAISGGSQMAALYGALYTTERHRHRYEVNNDFVSLFSETGVCFSGTSPDMSLIEAMEVKGHPFYIATQFHPEFRSKPLAPHPLFRGFVSAALLA